MGIHAAKGELRHQLEAIGLTILVHPDRIDASISQRHLVALLDGTAPAAEDDGLRVALHIPTKADKRGRNLKLVLRTETERPPKVEAELMALMQKAEAARRQLFTMGDVRHPTDRAQERVARLAFLAPDIIIAILDGRQPRGLTSRRLMKQGSIPFDWASQRQLLGF